MGAFLAKKLKWVSPGKLDDCEENVITFRFVFRRMSLLCKAMPDIASIPFEPLKFESIVIPADYKGVEYGEDLVLEAWKVESSAAHPVTGLPCYSLDSATGQVFTASVGSLRTLIYHLIAAAERQPREIKRMLEAHPNVVGSMVGLVDVEPGDLLQQQYDVVERLTTQGDPRALATARQRLALLLALHQLELLLIAAALDRAGRVGPRIGMNDVKRQRKLLRMYSGTQPGTPLLSIDFESSVRFASGATAPPWRQTRGEICYLVVETRDAGQLCVTCSRDGFFVNRGHYVDSKAGGIAERINYERAGAVFPTLVELLRAHSKHFDASIDKWEVELPADVGDSETVMSMQDDDADDSGSEIAKPPTAAAALRPSPGLGPTRGSSNSLVGRPPGPVQRQSSSPRFTTAPSPALGALKAGARADR